MLERDVLEVRLPVRRVASGAVRVRCEHAAPEGHWSHALPPPQPVPYQVADHTGAVVVSGVVADGRESVLNSFGLLAGPPGTSTR